MPNNKPAYFVFKVGNSNVSIPEELRILDARFADYQGTLNKWLRDPRWNTLSVIKNGDMYACENNCGDILRVWIRNGDDKFSIGQELTMEHVMWSAPDRTPIETCRLVFGLYRDLGLWRFERDLGRDDGSDHMHKDVWEQWSRKRREMMVNDPEMIAAAEDFLENILVIARETTREYLEEWDAEAKATVLRQIPANLLVLKWDIQKAVLKDMEDYTTSTIAIDAFDHNQDYRLDHSFFKWVVGMIDLERLVKQVREEIDS